MSSYNQKLETAHETRMWIEHIIVPVVGLVVFAVSDKSQIKYKLRQKALYWKNVIKMRVENW